MRCEEQSSTNHRGSVIVDHSPSMMVSGEGEETKMEKNMTTQNEIDNVATVRKVNVTEEKQVNKELVDLHRELLNIFYGVR